MVPAPDGAAVAYSYDGGRTWRLLLLDPIVTCRHRTWTSAAAALAVGSAAAVEKILAGTHPGNAPEGIEPFDQFDRDEFKALDWAFAHLNPALAVAVITFLSAPGRSAELERTRWNGEASIAAAMLALRRALSSDPALQQRVQAALAAERLQERTPSLLSQIAGTAPVLSARFEPADGGTVVVFGRSADGGLTAPLQTSQISAQSFSLSGLAPGHYTLAFGSPGYRSTTFEVELPRYDGWFSLQPAPRLKADVFLPDGGPLRGALVSLEDRDPTPGFPPAQATARTDERGHFELAGWTGREPVVLVTPKGGTQCYQWEQFSMGERALTLTLPSKRFRLGVTHLSGSNQEPSVGLEVLAWPEQNFGRPHAACTERRAVTDARGKIDLETVAVPMSAVRVRVGYRGARGQADGGTVEASYTDPHLARGARDRLLPRRARRGRVQVLRLPRGVRAR